MLTEDDCRDAKPRERAYRLADALGLRLEVKPNGAKYWRLKYRYMGKENSLSLGVYPAVSLEAARNGRDKARDMLAEGIDPNQARKAMKAPALAKFMVDGAGALTIRMDCCRLTLSQADTRELRAFMDATREISKEKTCL